MNESRRQQLRETEKQNKKNAKKGIKKIKSINFRAMSSINPLP